MAEIIIDIGLNQNRVAILENGDLVELYIEEENKRLLGNIYKGRVVNVLPGMEAAFVDIGLDKNAFLYVKDAISSNFLESEDIDFKDISIRDVVKPGQELLVQVVKEPIGTKGPRISTHITLPGKYVVLMPEIKQVGISRKIIDEEERDRLKKIVEENKPENMGIILRTASAGVEEDLIIKDIEFLVNLYQRIKRESKVVYAPKLIYRELDLVDRIVRDFFGDDTQRLVINDREKYKNILELINEIMPHLKSKIYYFDECYDIFKYFGIETMIKSALERKVWLKSGGYIVIDETEALTSIDVNTGKFVGSVNLEDTVLKTNIEAAKEIAKQLRLRNIGGIIIIDFIDMKDSEDIKYVINCLENELKKDKVKTTILGMTRLGLLEMTRKKDRKKLSSKLYKNCPYCEGKGKIISDGSILNLIEKEIKRIKIHTNSNAVIFDLNISYREMIDSKFENNIKLIENKFGIRIFINYIDSINLKEIKIRSMGKLENIKLLFENLKNK
ncbi:ribonuclease G [Caloranaerobacter azorensis H53214]|uniref:Ribonuclease G n=1 Tax=Caloranaerobacter azorensis H53214 TaxID=1156417 RepID=A0A096CX16_9FIRM|nr:Rne/Rng family ribonuclease [Caloranaerobacter azorensis]KGG81099.1 ribonuclease G [Caloranaerobacter azorensis H53214]